MHLLKEHELQRTTNARRQPESLDCPPAPSVRVRRAYRRARPCPKHDIAEAEQPLRTANYRRRLSMHPRRSKPSRELLMRRKQLLRLSSLLRTEFKGMVRCESVRNAQAHAE